MVLQAKRALALAAPIDLPTKEQACGGLLKRLPLSLNPLPSWAIREWEVTHGRITSSLGARFTSTVSSMALRFMEDTPAPTSPGR